ncbi:uncharacterized protein LOC27207845 [Drosophila simulans]|uniref:Uncharacterized protein LOC117148777 n=1 Tax=Drosophila mauritiana TaxID=7226 RepID=A0A6P8KQ90_DROMA|nr:uncharacterized protein LOC27207845 [Drosophila simulans]XP_033172265.1 uncharacterized protein LOC117148777 [Drosophila mauritiana]
MDKLRGGSLVGGGSSSGAASTTPGQEHQQLEQYQYPKNLIEQYLRASSKIKKFERAGFFKRFAPSVVDVQADFQRLAYSFEESGIQQYAAMCHIGYAKCESYGGAPQRESEAYLRAARSFLAAHNESGRLHLRTRHSGFREGALHCYHRAADRAVDGCVFKAAILRELKQLQRQLDSTSSFASPTHQIHDLEISAETSGQRGDFRSALQHYDDIVDNVYERRGARMYGELLRRVEVLRLLLLVHLNLPPARQSPAHIKLIEYYYNLAQFESLPCSADDGGSAERPGAFVPEQQQYALAEITCAWVERKMCDLKHLLRDFGAEFGSLSDMERQLLAVMHAELARSY